MAHILIIDDDRMLGELLCRKVARLGHQGVAVGDLEGGRRAALGEDFDAVFLDVGLPDGNGLELIPFLRERPAKPEVIIMTGVGDPDGAELAIKSGAWDYVEKGSSSEALMLPLQRALQYRQECKAARAPVALALEGVVGQSPAMRACYDLLAQAASSDANVLICGETGTGKELFARGVHQNSRRRGEPLVVVDCAALPESLVESMLFGHARGAFTGADTAREGLVAQAHGGTLFLDEVGELPLSMQKAFLRVLEEHRFRPLGEKREVTSDFRLVAATNRDLERMVERGEFREDLLFRLRAMVITLPPLRRRLEDLPDLVIHHLSRLSLRQNSATKGLSPDLLEVLTAYHWPGNVRELVNTLDRAMAAAVESATIYPLHLPTHLRVAAAQSPLKGRKPLEGEQPPTLQVSQAWGDNLPPLKDALAQLSTQVEKSYLKRLLEVSGGDIRGACQISGLGRSALYERLKRHGLSRS